MARCDSYPPGECTTFACRLSSFVGDWWGDADQWIRTAKDQGFEVTITPTLHSVVVYGPGDLYSSVGHVAVVIRVYDAQHFEVEEMNYVGWNRVDSRNSNMAGVMGFILPPGVKPGEGGSGPPVHSGRATDEMALEWASIQQLWNSDVDGIVNAKWALGGRLLRIAQK